MTITAHIDVSTLEGQELIRELEKHKDIVVIGSTNSEEEDGIPQKTYSAEHAENLLWEKLNEHYGTDIRNKTFKFKKITTHIDVSTVEGQALILELEKHKEIVNIDNPNSEGEDRISQKTYSVEEAFDNLYDKLQDYYGVDLRKL